MVRRKKRYLLVYSTPLLSKEKCRSMNLYYIEGDISYFIVRCYLDELALVKDRLKSDDIMILDISGTLRSLRDRKDRTISKFEERIH